MPTTIHLHPTAPLATRVLLPGDPGRALRLAQALLGDPKMFNHNRGLWGYTGSAPDGELLSIQSTGMGGPSAAIVVSELIELGARTLVRIGTCGALDRTLALGELLIAAEAIAEDGTSRALGGDQRIPASGELLAALRATADGTVRAGTIVSTDLFYDIRSREPEWLAAGALAVEMETATLYALVRTHEHVQAASVLIVSDLLGATRRRIDPDELQAAELRLGEIALQALLRSSVRA